MRSGLGDAAGVDRLLALAVADRLVDRVAGTLDSERAAVSFERFFRGLARIVELAAEDAATEHSREEPEEGLDERGHWEHGDAVAGDAGGQHEAVDALGVVGGQTHRDLAAQRVADHRGVIDAELAP